MLTGSKLCFTINRLSYHTTGWLLDTDKVNSKHQERSLSRCHVVRTATLTGLRPNLSLLSDKPAINRLNLGMVAHALLYQHNWSRLFEKLALIRRITKFSETLDNRNNQYRVHYIPPMPLTIWPLNAVHNFTNLSAYVEIWNIPVKWNTNLMQHYAGFISAESLYMFRAQAPIIRSI